MAYIPRRSSGTQTIALMVARAVAGRSVAGSATAHGLPRDAIRRVLQGHDPRLSRADDICRALGTPRSSLGSAGQATPLAVRDPASPSERDSRTSYPSGVTPLRDRQLAKLLVRLTGHWVELDAHERERFAAAVAAILELSGASDGRR